MTASPNLGESFIEVVKARRSIRAFTDKPVPQDLVRTIFETAMQAPSNCNTQPWFVQVVTGAKLNALREELPQRFIAGDIAVDHPKKQNGRLGFSTTFDSLMLLPPHFFPCPKTSV